MTEKTKTTNTVKTQDFLDEFRKLATENRWCSEAEEKVEERLGITLKPWSDDDWCCAEHSSHLRFHLAEGQPTELGAVMVAGNVKEAMGQGYITRPDAEHLLKLVPEGLRTLPPTSTVTVTFQVRMDRIGDLQQRSLHLQRRLLGDMLYSGDVESWGWEVNPQ